MAARVVARRKSVFPDVGRVKVNYVGKPFLGLIYLTLQPSMQSAENICETTFTDPSEEWQTADSGNFNAQGYDICTHI